MCFSLILDRVLIRMDLYMKMELYMKNRITYKEWKVIRDGIIYEDISIGPYLHDLVNLHDSMPTLQRKQIQYPSSFHL